MSIKIEPKPDSHPPPQVIAGAKNQLLAALPAGELADLQTKLESVSFKLGEVIYEPGDKMTHAYFPTTTIISELLIMQNGSTAEVEMTGNDGMINVALLLENDSVRSRMIARSSGKAVRMSAKNLYAELKRGGKFHLIMMRYALALSAQIAQTSACNRLHSIEQHLCTWLLLTYDRANSNKLALTHELISNMIGVRREYITLAIKKLSEKKMITNVRGIVTLIDRQELERAACECYKVVHDEYQRFLGQ